MSVDGTDGPTDGRTRRRSVFVRNYVVGLFDFELLIALVFDWAPEPGRNWPTSNVYGRGRTIYRYVNHTDAHTRSNTHIQVHTIYKSIDLSYARKGNYNIYEYI